MEGIPPRFNSTLYLSRIFKKFGAYKKLDINLSAKKVTVKYENYSETEAAIFSLSKAENSKKLFAGVIVSIYNLKKDLNKEVNGTV